MQFVGDAVMAVFGAPLALADHAERSVEAAAVMHDAQAEVNERWAAEGLPPFGLGIGLSTGVAAAALLGSEERLEYTLVGDTVNLAQRLQQMGDPKGRPCCQRRHLGGARRRRSRRSARAARSSRDGPRRWRRGGFRPGTAIEQDDG